MIYVKISEGACCDEYWWFDYISVSVKEINCGRTHLYITRLHYEVTKPDRILNKIFLNLKFRLIFRATMLILMKKVFLLKEFLKLFD